uniref:Alpha,alpha-trehalose-phosphate synthase (UDP-forming) n=1 Tax=Entomoneis paludosa TaxID=265537 RepID=A0A7S2Y679_9STRA|mmetsp:Transcript_14328/g.29710  ORF Transcript_14328/g.29710 Transcript_14328/m.29710 type:complete len:1197 (+) Transcript_14328:218-3808(+)|eukprot:CAMPEP_0172464618 /NCGR_PEP_ID=MMETSP1065-20121228/50966_1 /TAXON_ID=265537 /ORGANISM="Amphiprora paludosa, Strain CCMP125" /LENGTH=1196 /DNA_ID=CAMNT_0013220895 /DNA_START=206 /DNA_END=3796 /DNA_ORIENTATION=+
MSATDRTTADFEVGAVAHVNFRVRCESLGYGEEVFLVAEDEGTGHEKRIPLFTTAAQFPWYHSTTPVTLTLPPRAMQGQQRQRSSFTYRYAIHRAGLFYRWEGTSDGPQELAQQSKLEAVGTSPISKHELPLHLLSNRESYVVNDVLGVMGGHPDIDHVRVPTRPAPLRAASLHATSTGSVSNKSGGNQSPKQPQGTPATRKKHVGFAPPPAAYRKAQSPSPSHSKQAVHLNSTDGLVVVSAFLPIILHRAENGVWFADWDYEMLLSMQTHLRVTRIGVVKWRGWHGNTGGEGSPEAGVPVNERHLVEECLRHFNCVPVWIDPALFGEMYNGFCKGVLWPVLHNVTSVYSSRPDDYQVPNNSAMTSDEALQFTEYSMDDVEQGPIHGGRGREAELWSAYNSVNRQFADVVVQCFNEGDLVWIHGFHLLILPSYLTRRIPMAKTGIFLHTPFPSSEIFRTLWCREDLLRGMLNADQVGFHLFEYARHFLTCCRRLLGLTYGMIPDSSGGHTLAIDTNGRNVVVTSIHAGVEPPVLNQILTHSGTVERASIIRQEHAGKHIWCAIDRLESLKGVPLKLLALDRFLTRCPEWIGKIVLIQVGIFAFERGDDYRRTYHEVTQLVDTINKKWPGTVQFRACPESEMRLQQRMSILRAADLVVVTSIRDGLNLLPLEYTIAHQDALTEMGRKDGRKRGLCILSEFASCTRVMRGALHVNPWKISEIANAFHQALNMSEDERLRRIGIASEFVTRVTTQRWALAVMLDLKGVHKNMNPVQMSGAGLGLNFRMLGMDTGFNSLSVNVVAKAYRTAKNRLILLDYGGTIVSNDSLDSLVRFKMVKERSAPSVPTQNMINAIKGLCQDKRNTVFVVSGKERHAVTHTLGDIPNLGLSAEHGMFISWPAPRVTGKRRWETLVAETDRTWRSLTITIMEVYTSRTHGSYIEETEMKVLWQYRDADTEFGSLQAKELEDHLAKYLRSFPVDILHGGMKEGGYVEVRPKGVNKGVLAMKVLKRMPERAGFCLVLGDDHCDEPMLSVMRQIGRRVLDNTRAQNGQDPLPDMPATIQPVDVSSCDTSVAPDMETFTVTVGKKPSAAANYLHDVDEVQELLESLSKISARGQASYSTNDLRNIAAPPPPGSQSWQIKSFPSHNADDSSAITKSMSLSQLPANTSNIRPWKEGLLTIEDDINEEDEDDEGGMFF